jgi:Glycine zipper 2TM domain
MNIAEQTKRIHPLVALAAGAVTIFSLVGIAAITGILPSSHSSSSDGNRDDLQSSAPFAPGQGSAERWDDGHPAGKTLQHRAGNQTQAASNHEASGNSAPHNPAAPPNAPVAHKAAQNSPVGIGVGAVVGGVLGNQVGSGDGKTLATILGAVGGGYLGNEIAKKNQP